jgi:hypothetical protein
MNIPDRLEQIAGIDPRAVVELEARRVLENLESLRRKRIADEDLQH